MLDETHNKSRDIHPVKYCVWYSENLLNQSTLWFTAAYPAVSYMYLCTCLNHELQTMWAGFCVCPHAINCVYLVSTPDVMHMIKCTRLSPSLVGIAWETRLYKHHIPHIPLSRATTHVKNSRHFTKMMRSDEILVTFDVDVHDVSSLFTNVKQSQPSVAWWGYCVFGTFVLLNALSWSSRQWSHDLLIIIAVIHSHSP